MGLGWVAPPCPQDQAAFAALQHPSPAGLRQSIFGIEEQEQRHLDGLGQRQAARGGSGWGHEGSGPGECLLPPCSSIIFQALPTQLPFPISKGKMESNCASDADSPSHNISYTSFSDKPPFKMMYGATYLYSVPPSEGC